MLLLIDIALAYPILWPDGFVFSISYYFPLEPGHYLSNFLSSSWSHSFLGSPVATDLVNLPYLFFIAGVSALLGPLTASGVIPFLAWYLASVASYFFLRNFIRVSVAAGFFGALFMSYNPVIVHMMFGGFDISQLLSYAGIPLLIFTAARYVEFKRAVHVVLASVVWVTLLWYPPSMFAASLSIVLYVIVSILWAARTEEKAIRTLISTRVPRLLHLLLAILASSSAWLVLLGTIALSPPAVSMERSFLENKESMIWLCEFNSLFLKFPGPLLGLVDNRFSMGFPNGYLIVGTLITVLALFSMILCRREFFAYYFSVLYLMATFLTKGANEPFDQFYTWILRNVPFATIVRNPFHFNVLAILSISVLLALTLDRLMSFSFGRLHERGKRWRAFTSMLVILLSALSLSSLVLNPQVVASLRSVGSRRLPNYYLDCTHFLENELQGDTFRVIFPGTTHASTYTWSQSPIEVPPIAHNVPGFVGLTIISTAGESNELGFMVDYLFSGTPFPSPSGRSEVMGILNIKYAAVLNDMVPGSYSSPELDLKITRNMSNLVLEKEFGAISLFRNLRYRPVIYMPKTIVLANTAYELVESARDVESLNISDAAYLDEGTFGALHLGDVTFIRTYKGNPKTVIDDNQTSFWRPYVKGTGSLGIASLSNDRVTKSSGNDSLGISVGAGEYASSLVVHDFNGSQDWTGGDSLLLRWFGANTGQRVGVLLYTPDLPPQGYNYFKWSFVDDFRGWRTLKFLLQRPNDPLHPSYGLPSLSNIGRIAVELPSRGTWNLDQITIGAGFVSEGYEIVQEASSTSGIGIERMAYDKYELHVCNVSSPLFLVLSDSYSPLWSLKIQNWNEENTSIKHFKVNLYANGWLISGASGDLTITIEYEGRSYFHISLMIFSIYFVASAACVLLYLTKCERALGRGFCQ